MHGPETGIIPLRDEIAYAVVLHLHTDALEVICNSEYQRRRPTTGITFFSVQRLHSFRQVVQHVQLQRIHGRLLIEEPQE